MSRYYNTRLKVIILPKLKRNFFMPCNYYNTNSLKNQ